jgi:integrase
MTRLRRMMLEELERRNYSQGTIRCYLRAVAGFARYFHRSPDQLRPEHVREYQAYLFRERKLDASSVTQQLAALRFFFLKTLKKRWTIDETPYPKKVRRLPTILSQEEVAQLINAARTPFDRILLMTLYASGARCAEVARLQVEDVDSQRMVIHIRVGKGPSFPFAGTEFAQMELCFVPRPAAEGAYASEDSVDAQHFLREMAETRQSMIQIRLRLRTPSFCQKSPGMKSRGTPFPST